MEHSFPGKGPFFSKLLFSWFDSRIRLGQRKKIQFDDTLPLPENFTSQHVYTSFLQHLNAAFVASGKPAVDSDSLWKAFHNLIFFNYWIGGLCRLCSDALVLFGPVCVRGLIVAAEAGDSSSMLRYAVLLSATYVLQALFLQQFINYSFNCGQKVVTAAVCAVFHSSLQPRLDDTGPSTAEIYNIQSKDAASLREFVVFAHNLWASPLLAGCAMLLLLHIIGWAALVSVAVLCALVPLETALAKRARKYRKQVLELSDRRVSLIHEIVDGIATIKLTNLCRLMFNRVSEVRREELAGAWRGMRVTIVNSFLVQSTSIIVSVCTLYAYVLFYSSDTLTADKIFSALAVINILGRPIKVIPKSISIMSEAFVSLTRLASVVRTPLQPADFWPVQSLDEGNDKPSIDLKNVSVRYSKHEGDGNTTVLSDLNLSLQGPALVALVGANSAGKSTLLSTILGEILPDSFNDPLREVVSKRLGPFGGAVGLCAHDPWIMSGTVLYNIMLGRLRAAKDCTVGPKICDEDLSAAQRVEISAICSRCCLDVDFAQWPDGINTILGEKGVNASGGQRARIALARALYSEVGILLLDSPLAGLDASVSMHVFTEAIQKAAGKALVVLTTHEVSLSKHCDRVVFLEDGRVSFDGKPSEFLFNMEHLGYNVASKQTADSNELKGAIVAQPAKVGVSERVVKQSDAKLSDEGAVGSVAKDVYFGYIRACGVYSCLGVVVLSVATYFLAGVADSLLSRWADSESASASADPSSPPPSGPMPPTLSWYSIMAGVVMAANVVRYILYAVLGLRASHSLHLKLTASVLRAKFSFFDNTPSGRIYSRFASDMDTIDFHIPTALVSSADAILNVTMSGLLICYFVPVLMLPLAFLVFLYITLQNRYRMTSTALKRLVSGSGSPIFSYFREVLSGLPSIRGYSIERQMIHRQFELVDRSAQARLNWDAGNRWLGLRIDMLGALIVTVTSLFIAYSSSTSFSGGLAGLLLTYALKATNSLSLGVRSVTALENMFASPERVLEYCELESEGGSENLLSSDFKLDESSSGCCLDCCAGSRFAYSALDSSDASTHAIELSAKVIAGRPLLQLVGLSASYSNDSPDIVSNISMEISAGRLYGICGRTGSGKSTLSLTIARTMDNSKHDISRSLIFRGVPAVDIPLEEYRSVIQLFPQHYYILSGTVRDVIDPFSQHPDTLLRSVLNDISEAVGEQQSGLASLSLTQRIAAGGENLSSGQRQIISFARAILTEAQVVIFDEFNSNMDISVSRRAMTLLKSQLVGRGKAVVIICHRLEDAFSCDELFVMDRGSFKEHGSPQSLADDQSSLFSSMVSTRAKSSADS